MADPAATFDPQHDLISLHYDHAPDKDDGHSAAADRTILQTLYGKEWLAKHAVAVSGAYGLNAKTFNPASDAVMRAAWDDCGGWLAAHGHWDHAVAELAKRWEKTLRAGGDIWVKEGGQSDITADVLKRLQSNMPDLDTTKRVNVVQHSKWNEDQTTPAALRYTKTNARYVKIPDANAYLNVVGGNRDFQQAATRHASFGPAWRAAFAYYDPDHRLDFSDTGELLHILGLGKLSFDDLAQRFLAGKSSRSE